MFLGKTFSEAFKTPELWPGFQVAAACQLTGQTCMNAASVWEATVNILPEI